MSQNQFGIGLVNRKDLKSYLTKVRNIDVNTEHIVKIQPDIKPSSINSISLDDISKIMSSKIINEITYQKNNNNQQSRLRHLEMKDCSNENCQVISD